MTPAYNNRADLVKAIQGVVASSRTPLTETLYEAYRYFSGRTPKWGTATTLAQGGGTVSAGREMTMGANADPPDAAGNVFLTNGGGTYNSPMLNNPTVAVPANCQKNYVVMITNGQPEEDFSANADIKTMSWLNPTGNTVSPRTDLDTNGARPTNAGPPDYQQIPTISGGSPYGLLDLASTANDGGFVWLDELTYFIATADVSPGAPNMPGDPANGDLISGRQSIVTYTIGFTGLPMPVVQNAAVAAQGIYYTAQNAQQLQSALVAAFVAIRDWNPTSAAATVPISSLNRGESSTDIYLAFFGPSPQSTWPGTVKNTSSAPMRPTAARAFRCVSPVRRSSHRAGSRTSRRRTRSRARLSSIRPRPAARTPTARRGRRRRCRTAPNRIKAAPDTC